MNAQSTEIDAQAQTQVLPPRRRVFLPQSLGERIRGVCWSVVWQTMFRWSPRFANGWRRMLLRAFGARIGGQSIIFPLTRVYFPWNISIGKKCVIETHVILNAMGNITIGDLTHISQYAHLCAGTHDYEDPTMPIVRCDIAIGNDVWIAADAFVGPGVTMGDGSLLAARSSAFGDLPAGMVCIGEPARPIKPRDTDEVDDRMRDDYRDEQSNIT